MSRNRLFLPCLAAAVIAMGASTRASAQTGVFDPVTYELQAGSAIIDGCGDCGRKPIELELRGTMVLRRLPVRIVGELYSIVSIDFAAPIPTPGADPRYVVKGTGSLHRTGESLETQRLSLELEVNGAGGVQPSGEVEKAVADWPAFDVSATEGVDPARDPQHVFSIRLVAAPAAVQGVLYRLVQSDPDQFNGSYFVDDCKVCGRVTIPLPIDGSFLLRQLDGGANPVITYRVEALDFRTVREGFDYRITGEGEYTQGGEVALLQSMDLTVTVNEEKGVILSSGGKAPFPDGVSFPEIRIDLEHQNPTSILHVYSIHLVAAPAGAEADPLFRRGDANGDGLNDVSDAVFFLVWRFSGGAAPGCLEAADMNADGTHNLTDAVFLLSYLFQGGSPLPAPGAGDCGVAETYRFDCETSACKR